MTKLLMLSLVVMMVLGLVWSSCAKPAPAPTTPAQPATKSPSPSVAQPQTGGILKIILRGGAAGSIDMLGSPQDLGSGGQRQVDPALEYLLRFDANDRIQPELADSWEVSGDGKAITFHLHKGIKFSDGTDFNAEAVKYNLENFAPNGVRPPELKPITSYDVIDAYTLRLNLAQYHAYLLYSLGATSGGRMGSPTAMQIKTTTENMAKDHLVGTGPFLFSSWQRQNFVKFVKNPNYWQAGKPYLDGIEFNQVADPLTSIISFKKGDGQVIFGLTPFEANDLKSEGYDITTSQARMVLTMFTDGANADSPFANKLVRQAAEYALDKKALSTAMGLGYYPAVSQLVPEGHAYYVPGLQSRDYDPKKAKDLLIQAGYPDGFKTTLTTTIVAQDQSVVVAIQTYLKAVGIDATIDIADAARANEMAVKGWKGLILSSNPTVCGIRTLCMRVFYAELNVISMYRPDGWKAKVDAAVAQPDENKRTAQMKELIKTSFDEAMNIPLWERPDLTAQAKNVRDLGWCVGGAPFYYRPANVWLSK